MAYYILACVLALQCSIFTQAHTYADLAEHVGPILRGRETLNVPLDGTLNRQVLQNGDFYNTLGGLPTQTDSQDGVFQGHSGGPSSQTLQQGGVFQGHSGGPSSQTAQQGGTSQGTTIGGSPAQPGSPFGTFQVGSRPGLPNQFGSQAGAVQVESVVRSTQTGSEGGPFRVDSHLNSPIATYTNIVLRTLDVFQKSVIFRPVTRDVQVTEFLLATATETLTSTITTPGIVDMVYDDQTEHTTSTSTVTNTNTGYNLILNTVVANTALDLTITTYTPSMHRVTTTRRFYLEFPVSKTHYSTTVTTVTETDSYVKYIVGYNTGYVPPTKTVHPA